MYLVHRRILYICQIGITTLAPALVTESLLGHGQAIPTLTAALKAGFCNPHTSTNQMLGSSPRSRGENRAKSQWQGNTGEIKGRKNTVGSLGQGKSRETGAIQGLCYTANYEQRTETDKLNTALDTHSHPSICESCNRKLSKRNPNLKLHPAFLLLYSVNK